MVQKMMYLLYCILLVTSAPEKNYKVCTTKPVQDCIKLTSPIQCVYKSRIKDCLQTFDEEPNSFGVINGIDVYAAEKYKVNLTVVAELTHELSTDDQKFEYEFFANVTDGIKNFKDLRGTALCHLGFNVPNVNPDLLAKFDRHLSEQINGKYNINLEARLKFLSIFFGDSCIQGNWTTNSTLDGELKKKYNNLVKLCSNPANDKSEAGNQLFHCLLNTTKGVALTTLDTVEKYKDYHYICPNGTTINGIDSSCRWFAQPRSIIVANKDLNESLPSNLKHWLDESLLNNRPLLRVKRSISLEPETRKYLTHLILPRVSYKVFVFEQALPIDKYISGLNATLPDLHSKPKITFCATSSDKRDECKWLSAKNENIHLCCRYSTKSACVTSVSKNNSNFVVIPANDALLAMREKLTPIVGLGDKIKSLIVVDGKNVKVLGDLKNQIGCFDNNRGIAWFSFMKAASNNAILKKDAIRELETEKTIDTPLHACETNGRGISKCDKKLESSPLKCLEKDGYYAVTNETGNSDRQYTVLCKNGSLVNQTGLNVDENCYISIVPSDLVFIRIDEPAIEDIKWIVPQFGPKVENTNSDTSKLFEYESNSSATKIYGWTLVLIIAISIII